ncbi:cysteine proteinase [Gonapodya prolifera JEL478]|uniref:Ubiquitin carboxyl-terminal hydrolase n=1 Tax=Gonapodya prolifera (strain JEL478) TaxID=1344416 RepID=A0A139AB18_GONPJ|nr:cysteine proteinase [Gonapodya prolifera JEL478]|eukprot:KXS13937.1 cysteine proteinase [Gonapodya prolifera JEL478]
MVLSCEALVPMQFKCKRVTWSGKVEKEFLDATCWFQIGEFDGLDCVFLILDDGQSGVEIRLSGSMAAVYETDMGPSAFFLDQRVHLYMELDGGFDAARGEILDTLRKIRDEFNARTWNATLNPFLADLQPARVFEDLGKENWKLNPISANLSTTGLKNMGNTCYINSTVQCLSGLVPLAAYFWYGRFRRDLNRGNPLGTGGIVAERFAGLVQQLWRGDLNFVVPEEFLAAVRQHGFVELRGTQQQDSQEFLAFVMGALHEDLNRGRIGNVRIPPMSKKEEEAVARLPVGVQSVRAWERYLRTDDSFISREFQGQYGSVLECMSCHHTSVKFDTIMYLELPIPTQTPSQAPSGPITITDCLDEFVKLEVLDGDEAWKCPREQTPRTSTKRLCLTRLPNILVVQLKRFHHDGAFKNKLDQDVDFPIGGWDLSRYLGDVPGVARDESWAEQYTYDLYAVSNHFGGLNGGHYIAIVRNGYRGEWYKFDDSRVTTISERDVKTKAAYILFYIRRAAFASAL